MSDYEFSMPWPPSVNVWKSPFKNRMILTARGRKYRQLAIERLSELNLKNEMIEKRVSVSLVLNPPTRRKYDIDNFCKSLFDAMSKAGFWVDDEQVHELNVVKGEVVSGGRVDLKINIMEKNNGN